MDSSSHNVNVTLFAGNGEIPIEDDLHFPLAYRVIATIIHSVILITGILGCLAIIFVAHKERTLHTPTYSYLVSLAFADLVVISTAVPEAIVCHHVGARWIFGQVGCALFVFLNFLGINAGSMSIFAFTIERYIAVCHPFLAHRLCTLERTKKIILAGWIAVVAYCMPWLFLTELKPDPIFPDQSHCDFRVSKEVYAALFVSDIVVFYVLPLLMAVGGYAKIAWVIKQRSRCQQELDQPLQPQHLQPTGSIKIIKNASKASFYRQSDSAKSSTMRMLIVIVSLFAVSWLPFRGLLIYNSLADEPWLDIWYLLFAKTLIYMNCAMNPFLYNAINPRFRLAMRHAFCHTRNSQSSTLSTADRSPTTEYFGRKGSSPTCHFVIPQ
ncbi:thyrotropin-releasing hormone receptor-like isoform X2 [Paramacrobiotus metropolitanus]|uniref:thyrotropin-releasing hormone receptor-like isoform X2 n=1 Tax=Paramacrobiotus metropolitanus TaxID=2943436 RepID=UPI002445C93E|nr:thyrotropin-releasing hormone receptor-like isoform X2 [Paramacrobiotus metropolitanus]